MSGPERVHGGKRAGGTGAGRAMAVTGLLLVSSLGTPGCYTTQMTLLKSGLDSLRIEVDRIEARDSVSARTLEDTRRELAEQRDLLLATRATSSSSSREGGETLGRLEGKLDDIMARFRIVSERQAAPRTPDPTPAGPPAAGKAGPPATGGPPVATGTSASAGPDPTQLYDQATEDLTQGRYAMALGNYREYLRRFPDSDLADNAQYGAGECFFAQAQFDSALVEYTRVGARWGSGDRAPASLYKLGLCQERLGHAADARKTFENLVKRFPQSGESQLARDRLATKP
jgi:tol-pal system protein YbgF